MPKQRFEKDKSYQVTIPYEGTRMFYISEVKITSEMHGGYYRYIGTLIKLDKEKVRSVHFDTEIDMYYGEGKNEKTKNISNIDFFKKYREIATKMQAQSIDLEIVN